MKHLFQFINRIAMKSQHIVYADNFTNKESIFR